MKEGEREEEEKDELKSQKSINCFNFIYLFYVNKTFLSHTNQMIYIMKIFNLIILIDIINRETFYL